MNRCVKIDEKGNSQAVGTFCLVMNVMVKSFSEAEEGLGDRRTIRLEGPCPQAGIAAALRRAFEQASRRRDPIEDEFDRLLSQVH